VGSAIGGTTHLDLRNQQVYLFGSNATGNFTLNLRNDAGNALGSMLGVNQSISTTVVVRMGTTLYALSAVTIDGGDPIAVNWQNGSKALAASKLNVISLVVIKTDAGVYTVLGSVSTANTVA
jgi:hypothetical protein